jgi:hypothetical protein
MATPCITTGAGSYREAFAAAYGPVPKEHIVHHKCQNRRCKNPEHLVALTASAHRKEHVRLRKSVPYRRPSEGAYPPRVKVRTRRTTAQAKLAPVPKIVFDIRPYVERAIAKWDFERAWRQNPVTQASTF